MSVRKPNASSREAIHGWCLHLDGFGVSCKVAVGTRVPQSHVVRHHDDNVGMAHAVTRNGIASESKQANQYYNGVWAIEPVIHDFPLLR